MAAPESGYAVDAKHYQSEGQQPIEDMQYDFSQEGMESFLRGSILKYVRRFGKKGPKLSDAQKIVQYGKWLVDICEGKKINPRNVEQNAVDKMDDIEPGSIIGVMTAREYYIKCNGRKPEDGMCPNRWLDITGVTSYCQTSDKHYVNLTEMCGACWEQKVRVNV